MRLGALHTRRLSAKTHNHRRADLLWCCNFAFACLFVIRFAQTLNVSTVRRNLLGEAGQRRNPPVFAGASLRNVIACFAIGEISKPRRSFVIVEELVKRYS